MKRLTNNPVTVTCLLLCLCAAALVAFVTAHAEPPVTSIQACYNDTNGGLRRVNSEASITGTPTRQVDPKLTTSGGSEGGVHKRYSGLIEPPGRAFNASP
jgi:hypothetical protein